MALRTFAESSSKALINVGGISESGLLIIVLAMFNAMCNIRLASGVFDSRTASLMGMMYSLAARILAALRKIMLSVTDPELLPTIKIRSM